MRQVQMRWSSVALVLVLPMGVALLACQRRDKQEERLYFKKLLAPVGVSARVIRDVGKNLPTGGLVEVEVVVDADLDRDELDRLMRSFFRQAEGRRGFRDGAADRVDLRFYGSESAARARDESSIGRALRLSAAAAPEFTNRQALPLVKWATAALGPQPHFTGELKPRIVARLKQRAITVTIPFVEDDGSGAYVKKLTFARATTTMTSVLIAVFEKVAEIREVTFEGRHQGAAVIRVRVDRDQMEELHLRQTEEELGKARGLLLKGLLAGRVGDKEIERRLSVQRRKLYHEVFAKLPADQVWLAKSLR